MAFQFKEMALPGVIVIEPNIYEDERGFFVETYKFSEFSNLGINERFVQENHSKSIRSVLRGLHYQKIPMAQGKLVKTIQGEIFDVAVDIRKGSPTHGRWISVVLSAENKRMLYVPVGFAHGFCALSETAEVLYKVTEEYSPENDTGIIWNDPDIAISWPIQHPIVSKKDMAHPRLKEIDTSFVYKEIS